MTLGTYCKCSFLALLLCIPAASRAADVPGVFHVTGKLVSVDVQPGCGIFNVGTPATYKVVAGPATLQGRQITVVVPCIELPLPKGDLRSFVVDDIHYLSISRKNLYKIGIPARLHDDSWFYLRAASLRELK
jgi:hypothetical protein